MTPRKAAHSSLCCTSCLKAFFLAVSETQHIRYVIHTDFSEDVVALRKQVLHSKAQLVHGRFHRGIARVSSHHFPARVVQNFHMAWFCNRHLFVLQQLKRQVILLKLPPGGSRRGATCCIQSVPEFMLGSENVTRFFKSSSLRRSV